MRVHTLALRPWARLALCAAGLTLAAAVLGGGAAWCWTQAARVVSLQTPMRLPLADAAHAMWRLLLHGGWRAPARAFPTAPERAGAPGAGAYMLVALLAGALLMRCGWVASRHLADWQAGSPLALAQRSVGRRAVERGWVRQRTWARPRDLRRLWVPGPVSGRPYLGSSAGAGRACWQPSRRCSRW